MNNKLCKSCNIIKDFSEFNKDIGRKDGLQVYCKECTRLRVKNLIGKIILNL